MTMQEKFGQMCIEAFAYAWMALAYANLVDGLDKRTYERVATAWAASGFPVPIFEYIGRCLDIDTNAARGKYYPSLVHIPRFSDN